MSKSEARRRAVQVAPTVAENARVDLNALDETYQRRAEWEPNLWTDTIGEAYPAMAAELRELRNLNEELSMHIDGAKELQARGLAAEVHMDAMRDELRELRQQVAETSEECDAKATELAAAREVVEAAREADGCCHPLCHVKEGLAEMREALAAYDRVVK